MNRQNHESESPVKQALREIRRLKDELERERTQRVEPLAIVGIGLRLPGGVDTPDGYWDLLANGVDAVGPIPRDRWPHDSYYNEDADAAGKYYVQRGGFLSAVDGFDPEFFGIAPIEAVTMDPQHRLLLETVWEALEHAGIPASSLHGTRTGVFLGIGSTDYHRLVLADQGADTYASTGTLFSVAAGRISYVLGLNGPALAVDTACSSSLVAVHLAAQSLRSGESDVALAAGVSLMLSPELTVNFCRAGMLSRAGRCSTFDADADGYVRSEGCGVVVLKRLRDAQRDGDRIHAIVLGSAINQDGRSSGLTAPSGPAQEAVIRAALADAHVAPIDVAYVEAHGTGTSLGDPIEVQAIGAVFAERTTSDPVLLGSAKTNLGHLEAAAGMAGLIKVALMLEHGEVAPHLHFRTPNPHIAWNELPVSVATGRSKLTPRAGRLIAGVSSFGFSGTNSHVILESASPAQAPERAAPASDALVMSAPDREGLVALATRYAEYLRTSRHAFADICETARVGRVHFAERLAVVAADAAVAARSLDAWVAAGSAPGVHAGTAQRSNVSQSAGAAPAGDGGRSAWLENVARQYVAGAAAPWPKASAGSGGSRVPLPAYPFRRRRFWYEMSPHGRSMAQAPAAPTQVDPWTAGIDAATASAAQAPIEMGVAAYGTAWTALNEFTALTGRNTLVSLGAFTSADNDLDVDGVLSVTGIKPIYRHIVVRWLDAMVAAGELERSASGYAAGGSLRVVDVAAAFARVETALAGDQPLLEYVRHCAGLVPDVLAGRTSALESLFPGGSFDLAVDLYHNSTLLRYVNGVAASAARSYVNALPADAPIRVIEIGAGTGGTTGPVSSVLPAERSDYLYTDVSEIFLDFAAERFADTAFLRTALFDLEKDAASQGVQEGAWDIVVAANVVHAARDIRAAVDRVRRLLAPGGLLLLVESTGHHPWHDITTGLIEGWQHFEDDIRTDTPLLTPDAWVTLLREAGFEAAVTLPGARSPAAVLKQHVVAARAPGSHDVSAAAAAPGAAATPAAAAVAAAPSAKATATATAEKQPARMVTLDAAPAPAHSELVAAIAAAPESEREEIAAAEVRDGVIAVLRLDPSRPPARDARLMDLGLDSLMAVRLRNALQKRLGLPEPLPSTLVFDYPTIRQISRFIVRRIVDDGNAPAGALEVTAAPDVTGLTDAEVEAMLLDRLDAEGMK